MARRYGSSYSSSCFSSYVYDGPVLAQYACTIIVLAVYLGTLIWLCVVRRRTGSGKHLVGLPYVFALAFVFIQQAIGFISFTLGACRVTTSLQESYNWNIASMVFYGLQTFLFLWVVIWTLNTMLRKQLGARTSALKIALGLDLFLLGALLLAYIVLICNIYYLSGRSLYNYSRWGMGSKWISAAYVGIAFSCVYLISISGSGILALLGARSLKKKHGAGSSLMAGIAVLTLCLFVYSIVDIIQSGLAISPASIYVTQAGYTAMYWIQSFARAFAFITIIVIAKNAAWRSNMFAENDPVEQQYAYYQQEPPVYAGPGQHA